MAERTITREKRGDTDATSVVYSKGGKITGWIEIESTSLKPVTTKKKGQKNG